MDSSATDDDPLMLGHVPAAVYPAMLAATVVGQLLGMAIDAVVLGRRVVWIPLACSVLLEALVGARFGAARSGRSLTAAQCARLSAYYSLGLAGVTLPLWAWTAVTHGSSALVAGVGGIAGVASIVVVALAALLVVTGARWGLLVLLSPKRAGARP